MARALSLTRTILALLPVLAPLPSTAQAWLPPKGSSSYTVSYNDVLNREHYLPDGGEVDVGHTRSHTIGIQAAYSPADRWMLTGALPYVTTRFWGERPHPTEVDSGDSHSTVTDLRLSAHFQALERPVALAPYVALIIPTHDYPTLGLAAPGRGLHEAWFGFAAGKSLDAWVPRVYVQGRYSYAWVERVAGIAHDRSNVDLEIGYFLRPEWAIRAVGFWQFAHGGVDVPMPPSDPLYPYHDQLAAEEFFNVGFGTSYAVTSRVSAHAMYQTSARGENGHKLNHGVTVGFSVGFAPLR